jgi:uncharacterized protein
MTKRPWFLPESFDLIGMLRKQAAVTIEGLDALLAWTNGEAAAAERVRDAEHRADDEKRELRRALVESFTSPVDPEDLYELSRHLDEVINGAKDAVREAEVMAIEPDEHLAAMAASLTEGAQHLDEAFVRLGREGGPGPAATEPADAAVRSQRELERSYRRASSELLEVQDLREVAGRRELYRRFSRIGDALVEVAERVWYATVKES